ncbi:streptophobe family protein [Streptomyces changanensis]|uniref:Integral membrane protein n=1 Tax=Streptomyces kanasensis TaxID=936756 RepID=A0A100Y022_9ACTN|nr:hypothetical protein ATE80_30735 [Streptomyces kanasensis]
MSSQRAAERGTPPDGARPAVRGVGDALVAVLAAVAVMAATAALGLWAAGATALPGGAFPRIVAAVVVMAAGGDVGIAGGAGDLARTDAELTAMPLSVSLVGALTLGAGFVRPLRHRAVVPARELLARVAATAVLWLVALAVLSATARHTFTDLLPADSPADLFGELLDASPTIGFRADTGVTLLYGLLWVLGVLAVTLLVSRRAPLPPRLLRYQEPVRPAASAMLLLLLAYVVAGLVAGLFVAATRGHPADTFAVLLLGLPNVAWLALGLGIGGSWDGRVDGPFGLPMPHVLDQVLRGPRNTTLDVRSLAAHDERAWWLLPVAAVLLLVAGWVTAVRSPTRTRPWRHALHLAVAFALTLLVVLPLTRLDARLGLSLLGIFEVEDIGGHVALHPHLWTTAGLALLWGAVAGLLGGLLATRARHHGEVDGRPDHPSG